MKRRALLGALLVSTQARAWVEKSVTFDGLYKSFGVRGLVFSEDVLALSGKTVRMIGYMAPPLRAESNFFVLTREPLALCPFCQSDADWPVDIVVVYLKNVAPLTDAGSRLAVVGTLQTGSWTDPETGFVSQVRLVDADFSRS